MNPVTLYDKRWINAKLSGDTDISSFHSIPNTQVKFFYHKYCNFLLSSIRKSFSTNSLTSLKILEVGCGRGTASNFLSYHLGCNVVGIDFSSDSIDIARSNAEKYSLNTFFLQADLFDPKLVNLLPFNQFDVIISLGVLEHIENISDAFSIHYNLLSHGGLFSAMIVPEKLSIQDYFSPLNKLLARLASSPTDLSHLDSKTLSKTNDIYRTYNKPAFFQNHIQSAGFSHSQVKTSNFYPIIRPVSPIIDLVISYCYFFLDKFLNFLLQKDSFFVSPASLSRCFFLNAIKS